MSEGILGQDGWLSADDRLAGVPKRLIDLSDHHGDREVV
jgi:hypothetical protein